MQLYRKTRKVHGMCLFLGVFLKNMKSNSEHMENTTNQMKELKEIQYIIARNQQKPHKNTYKCS